MIDFCNYKWTASMEGGRIIHTGQPWMWYDENCVKSSLSTPDGILIHKGSNQSDNNAELIATSKPKEIHCDGNVYNPTVACGLLRSVETFGYGRFSAEIMLPKGKNLWPAFWLVGEDEPWPQCGEIDIMEAWTNRLCGYFKIGIPQPPYLVPSWNTTTNIHWNDDYQEYWNYDGHKSCGSRRLPLLFSLKRPAHNYIKYEVEWRPNIISFFANGHRVRTYGWDVAQHLLNKKMRVIFDLWTTQAQFSCDSPMKIRNFEYLPIDLL